MSESGNNGRQSAISSLERELFIHCQSDLLSEEGVRQIIERHGSIIHYDVSDYNFFFWACANKRVTEGIIQCLLEYFPGAASATDDNGVTPLHFACGNPNVTLGIIQLLVDADPDSVHREDNKGRMPLHYLCSNEKVDEAEATALQVMKLLIRKYPEAVRHANHIGSLPIHMASRGRSPEFCRSLIEKYPGSERRTDNSGAMPLHHACSKGSLATVEYLHSIFPDAINHPASPDYYPIHMAMYNPEDASLEIVQFLLGCDPNQMLIQWQGKSLFHFACHVEYTDTNIEAGIKVIKILFDADPEAIENNRFLRGTQHQHPHVQSFINGELVYARQAKDRRLMMTPDEHGQLPLHRALQNNVRLGSIMLLVKGNPLALQSGDNKCASPLHVACEYHDSSSVVECILWLTLNTRLNILKMGSPLCLNSMDRDGNSALHYACRGAKYNTIALLLKCEAASVSQRNAHGKLPIDLLWESNEVSDRESVEYMGSVFQLLKSYPEIVMNFNMGAIQNQSGNGKKRKYGNAELAAINDAQGQSGRAEDGESRSSKRRRPWWWGLWSYFTSK